MMPREDLALLTKEIHEGGVFGEVRVFEQVTFIGCVQCDALILYGDATFKDTVQAKSVRVRGKATFLSSVTALTIEIEGETEAHRDIKTNRLTVKGKFRSTGKVEAYEATVDGEVLMEAFDGYTLIVHGKMNCSEMLRCNNIQFTENASAVLNEVMGAKVVIEAKDGENLRVTIENLMAYEIDVTATEIGLLEAKHVKKDSLSIIHDYREIGK